MKKAVIFAGTPLFAASILQDLIAKHNVIAVFTAPDRASGRGLKLTPSPVKNIALAAGIPCYQPSNLKDSTNLLTELKPDVFIVAAYGMLIPEALLTIPKLGAINIHPSLLPKYRGPTPISSAILQGDKITGVTIMQMDKSFDTGAILIQKSLPIIEDSNTLSLSHNLALLGSQALLEYLDNYQQIKPIEQSSLGEASFCRKITKADANINWHDMAHNIVNKIHAFNPKPLANTSIYGKTAQLLSAKVSTDLATTPGNITLSKQGLFIAAQDYYVQILSLKFAGGKIITGKDAVNMLRNKSC